MTLTRVELGTAASSNGASKETASPPVQPGPPALTGRRVRLRPLDPSDHAKLYEIAVVSEVNFRWRFRGAMPSPEVFVKSLWSPDVLAQFVVLLPPSQDPKGLILAYNTDPRNQYTYVGIVMSPAAMSTGIGIEAVSIFSRYLFTCWPFHKIYVDVVEFNLGAFESAIDNCATVEGRLKDHTYYAGRCWDNLILSVYREDALRWAERIAAPRRSGMENPSEGGER